VLCGDYRGWGESTMGGWKSMERETLWLCMGPVSLIATSATISLTGAAHSEKVSLMTFLVMRIGLAKTGKSSFLSCATGSSSACWSGVFA